MCRSVEKNFAGATVQSDGPVRVECQSVEKLVPKITENNRNSSGQPVESIGEHVLM